jgi:hypothetical protein
MIRLSVEQTLLIHSYLIEVSGGSIGLRDKVALEGKIYIPGKHERLQHCVLD